MSRKLRAKSPPRRRAAVAVAALFAFGSIADAGLRGAERPNIVLLLADDLGYGDVGFNGNSLIRTPHLDAMARAGMTFTRFYSHAPQCSPARASVLTGRNGIRAGIEVANDFKIDNQDVTIAELAQTQGYTTGHFGKWHVGTVTKTAIDMRRGAPGNHADYSPPWSNGYDVGFASENWMPTHDPYDQFPINNAQQAAFWIGPGQRVAADVVDDRYTAEIIMDRALSFVEEAAAGERPFFVTIWFTIPHTPIFTAPGDDLYGDTPGLTPAQKDYFTVVTVMDRSIGRLRERVRHLSLAEETLLMFCSDNGPDDGPGGTGGFRGRKNSLYEGGVRVPAIFEWEGVVAAGSEVATPATTSDILPTLLDLWGAEMPDDRALDGETILPALEGRPFQRTTTMKFRRRSRRSLVDERYKLLTNDSGNTYELFDLISDPFETSSLIAQPEHAGRIGEMRAELEAWLAAVEVSRMGGDHRSGIVAAQDVMVDDENPASFARGVIENDTPFVFVERQLATIPSGGLAVDSDGTPGSFSSQNIPPGGTIQGGIVVDSFLVHFDPISDDEVAGRGTIVFEHQIVGVVARGEKLARSDFLAFGDPEFDSGGEPRQTLFGGEGQDTWTVSEDGRTFSFHLVATGGDLDELRILTLAATQFCDLPAAVRPPRVVRSLSREALGAADILEISLTVKGVEGSAVVVERFDPSLAVVDAGGGAVEENTISFTVARDGDLTYSVRGPEACPEGALQPFYGYVRVDEGCPAERSVSGPGFLKCDRCPASGAPPAELARAFVFGTQDLGCETPSQPGRVYTAVQQIDGDPLSVAYDAGLGFGYEILYADGSVVTDFDLPPAIHPARGGWEIYGPFDSTPNERRKFPGACPEELYDSFIGCVDFLETCDESVVGNRDDPCPRPDGIIFRVDVPNGLYRFVAAVGDADNPHAHRILAEDGGGGPPARIGQNHVTLVRNFDQAQQTIGEVDARAGEGVYARVGFGGKLPPSGDGKFPDPRFVNIDENGMETSSCPDSPTLGVTSGFIRFHQLQANSNPGPGSDGRRAPNGGDLVVLEIWRVGSARFRRGDANGDGAVDISDAISTLGSLFLGGGKLECQDAGDSNDDGQVDISDAIATLGVLFLGREALPPPGVHDCGVDPTDDGLTCERYQSCQ